MRPIWKSNNDSNWCLLLLQLVRDVVAHRFAAAIFDRLGRAVQSRKLPTPASSLPTQAGCVQPEPFSIADCLTLSSSALHRIRFPCVLSPGGTSTTNSPLFQQIYFICYNFIPYFARTLLLRWEKWKWLKWWQDEIQLWRHPRTKNIYEKIVHKIHAFSSICYSTIYI